MAISVEQINLWRQLDSETEHLEFKEAKTQLDYKDLCQYCVAIGNEGGGHLLLGIRNKPPRIVVNSQAINNPIAMAHKLLQTLKFRVDVEEVAHPDGRVVVLTIPPRPRGSAFHLDGAYWMRSGEALVPMTEDQLRRIHREGEPDWLDEPSVSRAGGARILELLDAPALFELLHLPYPSTIGAVMDRMVSERLIEDEGGGAYTIRRLGALLLAKDVNTFPDVSRKAPRVTGRTARLIRHEKSEARVWDLLDAGFAISSLDHGRS